MKKQPFLLMESSPSNVNWRPVNPVKRPGMHMLSSMQAIAHGSDSVQYFQWRKSRGSYEKFHAAVLGHKGGCDTRTFREVSEVGARLSVLCDSVRGSLNKPKAAFVFDWENWWALEDAAGPRKDIDYVAEVLRHYQAFWEQGIEVDFISMDQELDGYALVCAPLNYMYRKGYADKVRRYVEDGGSYVTTYFSGVVDDTDLCFMGHHPLVDVLGVIQEEIDAPGDEFENSFSYDGKTFSVGRLREVCYPMNSAQVLAVYEKDFYAGLPVITKNSYGTGNCYYLAAETDLDFLRVFYQKLFGEAGLENPLGIALPYGLTVTTRKGEEEIVFVMNFTHEPVTLQGIGTWRDIDTGIQYEKQMDIDGFTCKALKRI